MNKASESSLMKKTKSELVAIVLRKDDAEIALQEQVKELKTKLNAAETANKDASNYGKIEELNDKLKVAESKFNTQVECSTAVIKKLDKQLKVYKVICVALAIATVLALIF